MAFGAPMQTVCGWVELVELVGKEAPA